MKFCQLNKCEKNFKYFFMYATLSKKNLCVALLFLQFKSTSWSYFFSFIFCLFTFFLESFNLWHPLLMIVFYYQTKTPINFLDADCQSRSWYDWLRRVVVFECFDEVGFKSSIQFSFWFVNFWYIDEIFALLLYLIQYKVCKLV